MERWGGLGRSDSSHFLQTLECMRGWRWSREWCRQVWRKIPQSSQSGSENAGELWRDLRISWWKWMNETYLCWKKKDLIKLNLFYFKRFQWIFLKTFITWTYSISNIETPTIPKQTSSNFPSASEKASTTMVTLPPTTTTPVKGAIEKRPLFKAFESTLKMSKDHLYC